MIQNLSGHTAEQHSHQTQNAVVVEEARTIQNARRPLPCGFQPDSSHYHAVPPSTSPTRLVLSLQRNTACSVRSTTAEYLITTSCRNIYYLPSYRYISFQYVWSGHTNINIVWLFKNTTTPRRREHIPNPA